MILHALGIGVRGCRDLGIQRRRFLKLQSLGSEIRSVPTKKAGRRNNRTPVRTQLIGNPSRSMSCIGQKDGYSSQVGHGVLRCHVRTSVLYSTTAEVDNP